jgi:hypothetical protein
MGHGDYMKKVFEHQGIAMVKSVEFFEHEVPNAAFGFAIVKVLFWIPGIVSKHFQARLKDASKETRIVFSDPSYWIILPYTEKQKQQPTVKIPPPPLHITTIATTADTADTTDCMSCLGEYETETYYSSQILHNPFTDNIWGTPDFSKEYTWDTDCMSCLGEYETETYYSSQILHNPFTDNIWGTPDFSKEYTWDTLSGKCSFTEKQSDYLSTCRNSWTAMNSIGDDFRFCDTPFGMGFDTY